jgi:glycerol kinase
MTSILAIDQSTSASKALIFTAEGQVTDKATLEHQQYYPQPGWVEHDAEEIYKNTISALQTLVHQHADEDFAFLSITNQRETFVVFDRDSGKPLHKAIVWQCRRGEPFCQELIAQGHEAQVREITGLKIDTYFPASKMRWLLQENPDIKARLEAGTALISTIDAYLVYRLTGGAVFATDHTNACRTLLYDIHNLCWSAGLCELFGVPQNALPEVRESAANFGETDLEGLLPTPIPIIGVMGDSQAALFAEQCFTPGDAKVTFGTGSSVLLNIGPTAQQPAEGVVTTIAWVHDNQPTYAYEGIINFTGATIAWMRDQMQYLETAQESEALAKAVPDNGGVYLVPAFVGLSAPYWRPNAKAAILGLTPASTRNHIVRAALESIAYQVGDVLTMMQDGAGLQLQFIHADGGMVSNHFLMQFTADMTGLGVRASNLPELSAFGAVMSGLLGSGMYATVESLKAIPHDFTVYAPEMPQEERARYYSGWKEAVQSIL